jgi:hypothetical protein
MQIRKKAELVDFKLCPLANTSINNLQITNVQFDVLTHSLGIQNSKHHTFINCIKYALSITQPKLNKQELILQLQQLKSVC